MKTETFIGRASAMHRCKYVYSAINNPDLNDWVMIICPEHGPFHIIGADHLKGLGCEICAVNEKRRRLGIR